MDTLIIEHSGPLVGSVPVSGAKNAALPIMAACLLTEEESVIEKAPRVADVGTMIKILHALGVEAGWRADRSLAIRPGPSQGWTAPYDLVNLMRASVCVLGPLLARHGRAKVSLPGGCVIGPRPIDLHLRGLEALGATIAIEHGDIFAKAERLRGTTIHLAGPSGSSVLATANVMMAATLARGTTVIEHAACEPEVVDLANYLVAMGAKISGQGASVIHIEGVDRLHGVRYRLIPDRIEAGTLMIGAAMVGGDVTLVDACTDHVGALIEKLREASVSIEAVDGSIRVRSDRNLKAVDITTLPFPGFPTDLQAQMTAMMTVSQGKSLVAEKIYPERFMHVAELNRMGAQISREGATAIVKGVPRLSGAPVKATDLRASAALVVAGLVADNTTVLHGVEHLDRGYEGLEDKLSALGAIIRRQPAD
ncbi:MAG: UDP-N-acetylglucosamine 1-carboxyvinyltransferase [Candidatus Omnitrophica bacterium]|nr:UDP-N-acetylglucosamine 1-carboxyvinyltransferase [Candidatus Omnitrophota bacterium]